MSRAIRVIDDLGAVCVMDYVGKNPVEVRRIRVERADGLGPTPASRVRPGETELFWQIEQDRSGGRVLAAVIIGPSQEDRLEIDWSKARVAAVANPARITEYGGTNHRPSPMFLKKENEKWQRKAKRRLKRKSAVQ